MKSPSERVDDALAAVRSAHQDTSRLIRLLATLAEPGSAASVVDRFLIVLSDVFAADLTLVADFDQSMLRVRQSCGLADDSEILNRGVPLDSASAAALSTAGTVPAQQVPRVLAQLGLTTVMWAPLTREIETTSIIVVGRSADRDLGTLDLPILRSVTDRLSLVIAERERTNSLELLASSGHLLTRHLDTHSVLVESADLLRRLTGAPETWSVAVSDGLETGRAHSSSTSEPSWQPNESLLARWDTMTAGDLWWLNVEDRSIVGVAAFRDSEPCAVLYAVSPRSVDKDMVAILANYTAAAIVNAALYDGLHQNEAFLRSITDSIGDMVAIIDVAGKFSYASPSFASELGYDPAELVGLRLASLVHPDHREAFGRALELSRSATGYPPGVTKVEYRMSTGSGEWSWVESAIRLSPGSRDKFVFSSRVIDDRKRVEEQLRREARHDSLTGLANRGAIMQLLTDLISDGSPRRIGALFFDLDGFKAINDKFGHEAGDILLKQLAVRVRALWELDDNLARLGGDEFLLVLPDVSGRTEVVDAGVQISEALSVPFSVNGETVSVSASIGGAVHSRERSSPEAILRAADAAMYSAKKQGIGLVVTTDG
ncbi:diguanylate cyclase [Gordonia sp. TBRC 11910]|uniref:Diguanylate cyclase n=1 Tax=Gordonia asplenii TaxID=2725283 RepID=A0A848L7X5_9ACTN|nr:sensor domain-containing diguanylate cyclase [Gordonia asplenii]NMO03678.1 diguanylate cyclase [Gordonia asplenii]